MNIRNKNYGPGHLWRLVFLVVVCLLPCELHAAQCIAHRGFGGAENSLAAIKNAWSVGASIVEVDVRITSEGILVMYHDDEIGNRVIADMTADEIRSKHASLSTVADAVVAIPKDGVLLLDLKVGSPDLVSALDHILTINRVVPNQVAFQSRSLDQLRMLGAQFPEFRRYYVTKLSRSGVVRRPPSSRELAETLVREGLDGIVAKGRSFITAQFVSDFTERDLQFRVWTINDVKRMEYYRAIGVDAVISDETDVCRRVLNTQNQEF